MKLVLKVDARRPAVWQAELAARLTEAGHAVACQPVEGAPAWPRLVELVATIERLAYGDHGPGLWMRAEAPLPAPVPGEPDLALDLSGRAARDEPGTLSPLYDGSPDPAAAVAALLDGRVPHVAILRDGLVVTQGLPANERPDVLAAGLDFVLARVIDLLVAALDRDGAGAPEPRPRTDTPQPGLRATLFAAGNLAAKLRARLTRRLVAPPSWRVGWRRLDGPPIRETGLVPEAGWTWLPQAGRYYADPFLLEQGGKLWCFVEELPLATGKGLISAFAIGPDGRPEAPPRPVLETGSHLSYPYVFAEGGETWMIPESGAAGEVALYRATDFPWRWQRERALVEGIIGDATRVAHEGRLWLFAATQQRSAHGMLGSSWDRLDIWSAADLHGPFAPHPAAPALIDAGSARPAGRFFRQGDDLMRLAQDCRTGYGAGLAICRIDRLGERGFAQSVQHVVTPPAMWSATGLHTLDVAGGVEVIDCLRGEPASTGI